jgi:hypothetical protein
MLSEKREVAEASTLPRVQATVTPRGEKGSCAQTKTMSSQYLL